MQKAKNEEKQFNLMDLQEKYKNQINKKSTFSTYQAIDLIVKRERERAKPEYYGKRRKKCENSFSPLVYNRIEKGRKREREKQ